ncbi:hypothetical protein HN385_04065 [archaeon]|jgi:hypothetical protein|nr:hypothetical protein [archaeon]MBT3451663.1 hypothetical protein [archaeon]MBT6869107.1 hypothetical protein [archaeon]MBT7193350.1 hypothetical protein [archaeon]MBT7380358.1 hypothetical protein [archaeon]
MTDINISNLAETKVSEEENIPLGEQNVEISKEHTSVEEVPKVEIIKEDSVVEEKVNPTDTKYIIYAIIGLIAIIALIFGGFKLYDNFNAPEVIDVDGLHQENLEGDLTDEEGYVYNGFSFVMADGLWWTEVLITGTESNTLLKVPLHYGPADLENVTYEGGVDENFNTGDDVYIAIDPNVTNKYYTLALSELSFNVVKGVTRRPVAACTFNHTSCVDREILSCDNNPDNLPLIELALTNETEASVELDGACIKISGNDYDLVRAVDRLLLEWYGVM